jgi:hypothetical protein
MVDLNLSPLKVNLIETSIQKNFFRCLVLIKNIE